MNIKIKPQGENFEEKNEYRNKIVLSNPITPGYRLNKFYQINDKYRNIKEQKRPKYLDTLKFIYLIIGTNKELSSNLLEETGTVLKNSKQDIDNKINNQEVHEKSIDNIVNFYEKSYESIKLNNKEIGQLLKIIKEIDKNKLNAVHELGGHEGIVKAKQGETQKFTDTEYITFLNKINSFRLFNEKLFSSYILGEKEIIIDPSQKQDNDNSFSIPNFYGKYCNFIKNMIDKVPEQDPETKIKFEGYLKKFEELPIGEYKEVVEKMINKLPEQETKTKKLLKEHLVKVDNSDKNFINKDIALNNILKISDKPELSGIVNGFKFKINNPEKINNQIINLLDIIESDKQVKKEEIKKEIVNFYLNLNGLDFLSKHDSMYSKINEAFLIVMDNIVEKYNYMKTDYKEFLKETVEKLVKKTEIKNPEKYEENLTGELELDLEHKKQEPEQGIEICIGM